MIAQAEACRPPLPSITKCVYSVSSMVRMSQAIGDQLGSVLTLIIRHARCGATGTGSDDNRVARPNDTSLLCHSQSIADHSILPQ